jgi:hypothetical protein
MATSTSEVLIGETKRDTRGRTIIGDERWAELVAGYESSGLTQAQFARRERAVPGHRFLHRGEGPERRLGHSEHAGSPTAGRDRGARWRRRRRGGAGEDAGEGRLMLAFP